jgi:hypothetical protein
MSKATKRKKDESDPTEQQEEGSEPKRMRAAGFDWSQARLTELTLCLLSPHLGAEPNRMAQVLRQFCDGDLPSSDQIRQRMKTAAWRQKKEGIQLLFSTLNFHRPTKGYREPCPRRGP